MNTPEHANTGSSARVTVVRSAVGWELREEEADAVRTMHYTDWHRLERALAKVERQQAARAGNR